MGGNVDTRYETQPVTDHYLKARVGEDDPFWTKLYAKLLKEFKIERCSRYPNAKVKAMLMMMGIITPHAEAQLVIKNLHSKVGCFVDDSGKVKVVRGTG